MIRQLIAIAALMYASVVSAAQFQWKDTVYSHYSEQEPLKNVLQGLIASQSVPVVVSSRIDDLVNLRYHNESPKKIFQDLASSYNLLWYFDGYVMYLYEMEEIVTATIKLKHTNPQSFTKALRQLDVLDERFNWRMLPADKLIFFAGPKRFVEIVMEMVKVLDVEKSPATGAIYAWTDENGKVHFTSRPPYDAQTDEVFYGGDYGAGNPNEYSLASTFSAPAEHTLPQPRAEEKLIVHPTAAPVESAHALEDKEDLSRNRVDLSQAKKEATVSPSNQMSGYGYRQAEEPKLFTEKSVVSIDRRQRLISR